MEAQSPRPAAPRLLQQYHHQSWQTQNELPSNGIGALLQTRDGYLWLGTEAGLVRFDGVRFVTFDRNSTPALRTTEVTALFEDKAGTLWVGTDDGAVHRFRRDGFGRGEFVDVTTTRRLQGRVTDFHQDAAGLLWAAALDEVVRLDDTGIVVSLSGNVSLVQAFYEDGPGVLRLGTLGPSARVNGDRVVEDATWPEGVQAFCQDRQGVLWLGTSNGLLRFRGGAHRRFTTRDGLPSNNVRSLIEDDSGGLWIGTAGGGLVRFVDGRFTAQALGDGGSAGAVTALLQDHERNLWVATRAGGLHRFGPVPFSAITRRHGLPDEDVLSVFEDRSRLLWVGTDGGGLTVLSGDNEHYTYTSEEGLPSNVVLTVGQTGDGAIWVGTARGLAKILNGRVTSFRRRQQYPSGPIRAIFEDSGGTLWVGDPNGLHRLLNGAFTSYTRAQGLSSNNVSVIREDHEGTLWIGTLDGGLNRLKDGRFTAYRTAQGLTSDDVSAVLCDGQYVWVGTLDGNLHLVRDDRVLALPPQGGVTGGRVLQILNDERGSIWMSGQRGITRFDRNALVTFASGTSAALPAPILLDHRDGFGRWEFNGPSQSAGARRRDGHLLFASAAGVIVVDPAQKPRPGVKPPVFVERLIADGRELPISASLEVPAGVTRLEFHYTGLSYSVPERVSFRYRLDGIDSDWNEAGPQRVAAYTNVPGGRYTFRVAAANHQGMWNDKVAAIGLLVRSRFWETFWFYALTGIGLVAGVVVLLRLRVRRLEARERVLERLVDVRTSALSQEVAERRRVEDSLRRSRDELEDRVRERTTELSAAYAQLQKDVAERRRLEEQLAQVQKLESIGRLAGGVAHDINNVLTVVLSYSDLVDAGLGPHHPLQAQLRQIRKAAERASNLTHRLLAFARKQVIEPRVINLSELTINLDGMLHRLIGEDVELTTVTNTGLWSVKADPHQFEQVLVNLAVNARDAMPNGGRLTIETANVIVDETFARLHPTLKPGEYVRLTVTDTGVGMDEHVKKHVFEPFFTTKEPGRGTGLGLATCYGIVQQMGGAIFPESELGRGTVFSVYIPRVDLPAEPTPSPQEIRVRRGHETVLLVEDEPLVREIAKSALTDQGYQVLEAEHGEDALGVAQAHHGEIDLVLTDVVMPKMGGRELVEELRRTRPGVRVLYMSGYAASTIDEQDVVEAGTSFLRKPFALAEMLRKVREVLDEGTPSSARHRSGEQATLTEPST